MRKKHTQIVEGSEKNPAHTEREREREPVPTCQFTLGGLERQLEELLLQLKHFASADDLGEAVIHVVHLHKHTPLPRQNVPVLRPQPTLTAAFLDRSDAVTSGPLEPLFPSVTIFSP